MRARLVLVLLFVCKLCASQLIAGLLSLTRRGWENKKKLFNCACLVRIHNFLPVNNFSPRDINTRLHESQRQTQNSFKTTNSPYSISILGLSCTTHDSRAIHVYKLDIRLIWNSCIDQVVAYVCSFAQDYKAKNRIQLIS